MLRWQARKILYKHQELEPLSKPQPLITCPGYKLTRETPQEHQATPRRGRAKVPSVGMVCATCYTRWQRSAPKCITPGCRRMAVSKKRCRPHERDALLLASEKDQAARLDRFAANIEGDSVTGCWNWVGPLQNGYSTFQAGGAWYGHRFAWVWFMGGHAPGRELDHLCNNRACVRPDHLAPVTSTMNERLKHQRELSGRADFHLDAITSPPSWRLIQWAAAHPELPFSTRTAPPPRREGQLDDLTEISLDYGPGPGGPGLSHP